MNLNNNKKAILLIDGDNIAGGMGDSIYETAKEYGRVSETHLFANFKSLDSEWPPAAYRHAMVIHHLPVIISKKNTTDIGLTIEAMSKLYTSPETEVYIIASNDTDFMPLAAEIRRQGKTAVCLYTAKDNVQQLSAYDMSKLVEKRAGAAQDADRKLAIAVRDSAEAGLRSGNKLMLNRLSAQIKKKLPDFNIKKSYKKPFASFKNFLKQLFADYPDLFSAYEIQTDYISKKSQLQLSGQ